jgi:hypothetical protein
VLKPFLEPEMCVLKSKEEEINLIKTTIELSLGEKSSSKSSSGNSESQSGRRGGCPGSGEIFDWQC